MKHFLAIALLTASFSSHALVVARLTNIECVSADGAKTIIMKFDSSKSIFGAQTFEINGNTVTKEIRRDNEYKVVAGDEIFVFEVKEKKEFTTILESVKNQSDSQIYDEKFEIDGEKTEVACTVDTKFRFRK